MDWSDPETQAGMGHMPYAEERPLAATRVAIKAAPKDTKIEPRKIVDRSFLLPSSRRVLIRSRWRCPAFVVADIKALK